MKLSRARASRTAKSWLRLPLAALALAALAAPLAGGCSSSLSEKECGDLRVEAFEMLGKAQKCNNDAECRQSDWPSCPKPVSMETYGKIGEMKGKFTKGKCQEPKADCKEPPEVFCKQGLCVHREKGTPEGASNTPVDQIKME
jgi:hypothetical protein